MAFTKINAAGIGTTETVTVDGLTVINNGSFGGNLSVGGTLTYEDVTNVDSVGLITARNGIVVGSGITLSKDGDIFATGITTISGNVKVGSGITLSPDGDIFATGVTTVSGNVKVGSGITLSLSGDSFATGVTTVGSLDVSVGFIKIPDSIIHKDDANTMIRFPADDTITGEVGGIERLRINSTGIGVTGRLSVHHSIVDTEGEFLRIGRTDLPLIRYHSLNAKHGGATANNYISFLLHNTSDTTSQSEVLRLRADGHVGIGTTVPESMLHISSGTSGDCVLILESDEDNVGSEHDNPFMLFRQDGGIDMSVIGMNPYGVGADNNVLHISNSASGGGIVFKTGTTNGHTNATERLRIKASGLIGIGTDNPDCNLHVMKALCGTVNSDNNSVLSLENSNHCVLQMLSPADKSSYIMFGDPDDVNAGQIRYDHNINQLEFQTSAANVLSFNSGGYHRFWKHPMFISNATNVYGSAGSLTASPAAAKAQFTSVADNNSNWDNTNKNFVCPVNGYYQITVDVSLGNVTTDQRRIFIVGYTLGGATGVQSNYVEVLDDNMASFGNYNYSHPWFFTAGTTIAAGINGNSGTLAGRAIQLCVHLITATSD